MINIDNQAFGFSKCIFALLDCKPPTTIKNRGLPRTIYTTSNDNKFSFEIKVASFAMKIIIRKAHGFNDFNSHKTMKTFVKHYNLFEQFSDVIVYAYCSVLKSIDNTRIRSIISNQCINDLESRGWPVGVQKK